MLLFWEGGDWGTVFRPSFGRVNDGSPKTIELSPAEQVIYDDLIKDNGHTHSWILLEEFSLKNAGLSTVSDEGISLTFPFLFLLLTNSYIYVLRVCSFFSAAKALNDMNRPVNEETFRMKKSRLSSDDRVPPKLPAFLRRQEGGPSLEESGPGAESSHGPAFRPSWGFRMTDSVVGSTKLSANWSLHSITLQDYTDIVTSSELARHELIGAKALATVSIFTLPFLFHFLPLDCT